MLNCMTRENIDTGFFITCIFLHLHLPDNVVFIFDVKMCIKRLNSIKK